MTHCFVRYTHAFLSSVAMHKHSPIERIKGVHIGDDLASMAISGCMQNQKSVSGNSTTHI